MQYIYKENTGILVNDEQAEQLKDFFSDDKPLCNKDVTYISVSNALDLIEASKEVKPIVKKVATKKAVKKVAKKVVKEEG